MKKHYISIAILLALLFIGGKVSAQTIMGVIKAEDTQEGLYGATIIESGTNNGTLTDIDGHFSLRTKNGYKKLVIQFVGYEKKEVEFSFTGNTKDLDVIYLSPTTAVLQGIEIIADRAKERETPVAFTNIESKDIEERLASQDLPLVLNNTPSVYATAQGGGAGDARINVRGFNQRNIAIMINGVPVNDMENGWVYWSNWDGISDATSSIQVQRGLSAVNLATPSVGGTMNVITSPAEQKLGGKTKFEYGSGNYMKATVTAHTGMINEKFALSFSGVRKVGEGVIDGTWTDAWAYYLGAAYNINSKNRLELYAMGAPQRHGQNLYKQNIAAYDHDFAKDIDDYDQDALSAFQEADAEEMYEKPFGYDDAEGGRYYNENWSPVSSSYKGKQYWNGSEHDRYSDDFINERENYYHKPLINLNWYTTWSDKVSQFTTLYYSGGTGGGSGTIGKLKWNYHDGINSPSRWVHYDKTIQANKENGASKGILRNSVNEQNTFGALSKVKINWNENLKSQVGIDWRTAEIDHYREVRDLLGGSYYLDNSNDFEPDFQAKLGDKIAYDFTNKVNWLGGYFQTEWTKDAYSTFLTIGYSGVKYNHTNHFKKENATSNKERELESDVLTAIQAKGGFNYKINESFNVYINAGYVEKLPIVDAVFDDKEGRLIDDPTNEKFISGEIGTNYRSTNNVFNANVNLYYTTWNDRVKTISDYGSMVDGNYVDGLYVVTGLDAVHMGVEVDFAYKPIKYVRFDGAFSIGDWHNTNDADGYYRVYGGTTYDRAFYTKDLKIGDAPQTQMALSATVFPVDGLYFTCAYKYYADFYADWNPDSRNNPDDREESWETPAYGLLDFHLGYNLPIKSRVDVEIFAHLMNALNTVYVQDAVDNSKYNAYRDENKNIINPHKADAAEVFLGVPRIFNVGLKVNL